MSFILNYKSPDVQTFKLSLKEETIYETTSTGLTYVIRFTHEQTGKEYISYITDISTIPDRINIFEIYTSGEEVPIGANFIAFEEVGWYKYEVCELTYVSFYSGIAYPSSFPSAKLFALYNYINLEYLDYLDIIYLDDATINMYGYSNSPVVNGKLIGCIIESGNGILGYPYPKDRWKIIKDKPTFDNEVIEMGKMYLDDGKEATNTYDQTKTKYVYKK